jgi:5-methylcytosine-specific restriction endonuclease McrA
LAGNRQVCRFDMSPRAAKLCRVAGCPHARPCPEAGHEPKAWAGSKRRKQLPPGWEKLRRFILQRDPICTECGERLSTEVHHRGDADDHRPEMLAGICSECHGKITSRQGTEAKQLRREAAN